MADDTCKTGDHDQPSADEAALAARLRRLGERLEHPSGRPSESELSSRPASDPSAIARGLRLSTELVAGVVVGVAIGWLLDRVVGTSPWGIIVFLLLGVAAGILNVMRTAGMIPDSRLDRPGSKQ